ncbi:MAG: flagellar biosynthetic protein FliO [Acidimicrobiales bacterium]
MGDVNLMETLLRIGLVFLVLGVSLTAIRRLHSRGRAGSGVRWARRKAPAIKIADVVERTSLGHADLAVVRFGGHDHLLAITASEVTLIGDRQSPSRPLEVKGPDEDDIAIDLRTDPVSSAARRGFVESLRERTVRR